MTKPASFLKSKSSFIPEITGSSPPSFLKKTYEILENPVYSDIMSWNDDGKAIIIKDISELVDKVLPIFFKHKNFTSYVRQLNLYGFRKVKGSSHFQAYFHPMFQRGKKDLLARMKRKNNDNLLIFKPHLMDSMQDDEEPRLKAEHSASLSQEPQAHEDADLAESENLQAKKVQKELNERINMVENQLKQFTEQNRILVNIIQKRDLELDSLIRRCIPACSTKDAELHTQSQDFSHQISIPQPLVSSNAIVMSNPVLLHKMQTRNMQIIPSGQSNQNVERSNSNMKSDEGTYRTRLSQKNTKETNEGGTPKNFSSKFASSEGSFKSATEKRANKTEEF